MSFTSFRDGQCSAGDCMKACSGRQHTIDSGTKDNQDDVESDV